MRSIQLSYCRRTFSSIIIASVLIPVLAIFIFPGSITAATAVTSAKAITETYTILEGGEGSKSLSAWPARSLWSETGLANKITIEIKNGKVTGSYEYKEGKMDGTLSADGKTISGHWKQTNNSGRYTLTIADDGRSFSGKICYGEDDPMKTGWGWAATLIGPQPDMGQQPVPSLTGAWVHSADPRTQTPDSKVIVVQDGNHVTLTHSYKVNDRWVTLVCRGSISGRDLRLQCIWAPGGNPFGYANGNLNLRVSPDGNHLDGSITANTGGSQESHYSRLL